MILFIIKCHNVTFLCPLLICRLMFASVGQRGPGALKIKIIDYKLFTDESHDIMLVKLENTVATVPVKLPDCNPPVPVPV